MTKLISWIALNGASIIGFSQVAMKAVKELLTWAVNFLFPLFPSQEKFKETVLKVREVVNKIDDGLEKVKAKML